MTPTRRAKLLGKKVMIAYKTSHIDRAGETGAQVEVIGEVVAIDVRHWAIVVTEDGLHLHFPVSKLYRASSEGCYSRSLGCVIHPDYMGVEELVRDFHSAKHPVTVRWLDRRTVVEMIGTEAKA